MPEPLVIDSSVLLAVALDEPGGHAAEARLAGSAVSTVNLAELLSQLIQRGLDPDALADVIRRLDLEVIPADLSQAIRAARLHAATRAQGLALADCFCLALAQERGAEVLTADRAWSKVKAGVPITILR
jgi:PIN domain nuclease of toxin-antitoxin system